VKLSPRDRRMAIIGAVLVGLILLWYFGIDRLVKEWSHLNEEIAEQRKILGDVEDKESAGKEAQALRERIDQEVATYYEAEQFEAHMARMIDQLTQLYPGVTRLDTMPTQVNETHAKCSLSLTFECGLGPLVDFLRDLQDQRPLLVVDNLRVTTNDKTPSLLRVRMAVCSFAMREEGEEGAG